MNRRRSRVSPLGRPGPQVLTKHGICGTLVGCPGSIYTPSTDGGTSTPPPQQSEPEWKRLVDLLLHVSPEDFEAAVAAVRLHRRLELR